ncbi:serine hydrolase domain-containing protein [Nocardia inohanensis]|uniref:serine hydrolase domain-containing protein n=1 Tax=Nocardia inohanensis TaxID=209246 RepID=UPI001FDEBEA1|nr:serine hydrolase domain-containing protein [Nocardia inohanensis]
MRGPKIHGAVAEGWGHVADAFRENFTRRGEIGGAVAVFDGDRAVVDLWAGWREVGARLPWERDTVVPVFSVTKGVAALVVAMLVSAGRLEYDAAVAGYWPEFAAHGKERITVRELIDHRAGLQVLRGHTLRLEQFGDLDALAEVLAGQRPAAVAGHGYHPVTAALYQNELVRRVDPAGRSIGQIVAAELGPYGVDFTLGWPDSASLARVAVPTRAAGLALRHEREVAWRVLGAAQLGFGAFRKTVGNLGLPMPDDSVRRDYLRVELAGTNGVGDARSIARMYAAAIGGLPMVPLSAEVRAALAEPGPPAARDAVLHTETRFHLGFRKSCDVFPFGSADRRAYGTPGLGGSLGFADPATGLGFAYVTNRLGLSINLDRRAGALCRAVFS